MSLIEVQREAIKQAAVIMGDNITYTCRKTGVFFSCLAIFDIEKIVDVNVNVIAQTGVMYLPIPLPFNTKPDIGDWVDKNGALYTVMSVVESDDCYKLYIERDARVVP